MSMVDEVSSTGSVPVPVPVVVVFHKGLLCYMANDAYKVANRARRWWSKDNRRERWQCGLAAYTVAWLSCRQRDSIRCLYQQYFPWQSDNTAEMIKHVMFGYFSQRSGLLVHLEDSYLTRIQSPGCHPTYWETTMATKIEDYRAVEGGVMIAHSGKSESAIITRFGGQFKGKACI
ncbi:hypothetical protein Leryth_018431 [Lithospermum erythrorhizon]|nr:hypothetical protein Leryth_018431 [Lithospermum erythrorhizon]